MTLANVLNTISGGTKIRIIVDHNPIFDGYMADSNSEEYIKIYLDREVYRINVDKNTIILAC